MDLKDLAAVLEALALPAFWVDGQARVSVVNPAAALLFDAGFRGRHYVTALRQPRIVEAIESVLAGEDGSTGRYFSTRGGAEAIYAVTARPLSAGGRRGVLVTLEDTTAMRAAGQMRRDFVANVSHELRTPLTALLGFIETLGGAARDDPAARDRFLAIMAREAMRMNRLVQDLLSLSRLESEERIRPTQAIDLAALLVSVRQSLMPMIESQRAEVKFSNLDGLPEVPGDSDQLRQVFTNLIENAMKYGGKGQVVRIDAEIIPREPGMRVPAVRIDISDQGDGIEAIHIPRLTERFYRVDTHRSREMGGTGLGLAIVKHIVNRHRGRLRIESVPGHGSTFSVLLPTV